MGFVDFTKLLFALYSLTEPFNRVRSIPEHVFIILSQRKACGGRFREEIAGKRTGPIRKWPPGGFYSPGSKLSLLPFLPLPNERKFFPRCFKKANVA